MCVGVCTMFCFSCARLRLVQQLIREDAEDAAKPDAIVCILGTVQVICHTYLYLKLQDLFSRLLIVRTLN